MRYMYQYQQRTHADHEYTSTKSPINVSTTISLTNEVINNPMYIRMIHGTIIGFILTSGLFLNGSLVTLFTTKSQLRTPTNLLLSSLTVSNCILCIFVLPSNMASIFDPEIKYEGALCYIIALFSQLWWVANVYVLTFLSIDRYKLITTPLCYRQIMTTTKSKTYIAISWAVAIIIAIIPTMGWTKYTFSEIENTCTVDWNKSFSFNMFFTAITFWIPFLVITYCYISIISNAHGNVNRIGLMLSSRMVNQVRRNSIYKTVKTSFVIVFTFLIAWVPHFTLVYIYSFSGEPENYIRWKLIQPTKYLPVFIYPYIFAYRNSSLRRDLHIFYDKFKPRRDIRKIEPARTIDENDFPENVSRRNSRTESMQSLQPINVEPHVVECSKKSSRNNSLNSACIERGVYSRQKSFLFMAVKRDSVVSTLPSVEV
ncbi:visual pigment-like receptor peropsin [Hydractinia symbiolongicarpus]|uniref:visual pigment-like receptor peropsin n=1 Tax=Hydractinia symbiolongicarpus TaxID=13093 RepID=UPI00254CBD22|nr:visual pigment-like receptor peropsin [Hydractinia symbiolongicarpus]